MRTKPKILLGGAVVFFVTGLLVFSGVINVQRVPALYVLLPVSLILFGMFLVTRLFEQESSIAVDDQQRALKKEGIDVPRNQLPAKQGGLMAK